MRVKRSTFAVRALIAAGRGLHRVVWRLGGGVTAVGEPFRVDRWRIGLAATLTTMKGCADKSTQGYVCEDAHGLVGAPLRYCLLQWTRGRRR